MSLNFLSTTCGVSRGQSRERRITKCSFSTISPVLKKPIAFIPWLPTQEQTQYPPSRATVGFSDHERCMDAKCLITVFSVLSCEGNSGSTLVNFQREWETCFPSSPMCVLVTETQQQCLCFWLKELLVSIKVHRPSFYLLLPLVQLSFEMQNPSVERLQQPHITGDNNSPE